MLEKSWVQSANHEDCPFPLNNLPYGVFSKDDDVAHMGVAIGDMIFDCHAGTRSGLLVINGIPDWALKTSSWNEVMSAGPDAWDSLRNRLKEILAEDSKYQEQAQACLIPQEGAKMHIPFEVAEYTDFYAGRHHATNVGTMFRGPENALPPNWLHIPIGYNGRASSVVVSGTNFSRPMGQIKSPDMDMPIYAPSKRFDFELELGAIVGTPSQGPVNVDQADDMIFGYVLLNDWSARDIQAWEYQPLGPFQAKATATTISPWIVTKAALEPFRIPTPERTVKLLDYLQDTKPMLYDIDLEVYLTPEGSSPTMLTKTNYREMYYSSAQQLAHHTTSGCPMRVGDLLGSGTISGAERYQRGSLLELSWGGKYPVTLNNSATRSFIEDNDTITITGVAIAEGYRIGFGECIGTLLPQ